MENNINYKVEVESLQRDNHFLRTRLEDQERIINQLVRKSYENPQPEEPPMTFITIVKLFIILVSVIVIFTAIVYFIQNNIL
jgi:hypothetical protein